MNNKNIGGGGGVDSVLSKSRKFGWKLSLLRGIISDHKLKEHTTISNGKLADDDFMMISMEQTSNVFHDHVILITLEQVF